MRGKVVLSVLAGLLLAGQAHGQNSDVGLTTDARNLVDWILNSADHKSLPFVVIDKQHAQVFVFEADGTLRGASAALIGVSVGDDTAPGIGSKKLSEITIPERTTPAGRFVADLGRDIRNAEILWIDYDSGLSMHIVVTGNASERRAQRLASPTPADRRITYGCVNVTGKFYNEVIRPTFKDTNGIVYIMPEVHSIETVFGTDAYHFSQR